MTKAEVHAEFAKNKAGEYFAYIEGRNNSGLHQYRFVRKQFPATVYTEWAVYWALRPDEFYKVESSTLAKGMERNSLQVFTDATGLSHHQAVWVMKKSGAPK